MQNDWIHILWIGAFFLALFVSAEILYRKCRWPVEITRKTVHLTTGVITMLFPVFLQSHWSVLLLCVSFAGILLLSLRTGLLPSINAIDRKSYGSLLYPLSVYLGFLFYIGHERAPFFFYLPVLTLAVCDPAAALAGKKYPLGVFKITGGKKSMTGCLAFLITSMVLTQVLISFYGYSAFSWWYAPLVGLISMTAEAMSGNGWDNLSIPLAVMVTMQLAA